MTYRAELTSSKMRTFASATLTFLVLMSIATAALKLTGQSGVTSGLGSRQFLLSAMLAVLYRAINPLGWVAVLSGLGYRVDAVAATNIWLAAESRRWLPGGVWGYASRAVASARLGVPVVVASASMLVELMITIAAAVLVSCVGLALYFADFRDTVAGLIASDMIRWRLALLASLVIFVLVGLIFLLRARLIAKLNTLDEKWQVLQSVDISFPQLSFALFYFLAMACLNGVVNLVMLGACSDTGVPVIVMIAATATAWVIGYLAFFSPGGLFVREAALAMLLLPWIPYQAAFAVAILSRLAQLLAEVICMLPACFVSQRSARQERQIRELESAA